MEEMSYVVVRNFINQFFYYVLYRSRTAQTDWFKVGLYRSSYLTHPFFCLIITSTDGTVSCTVPGTVCQSAGSKVQYRTTGTVPKQSHDAKLDRVTVLEEIKVPENRSISLFNCRKPETR